MLDGQPPTMPLVPVTSACVVSAANTYQVHPSEILTVMKTEMGSVGKVSRNKDGTVDIGPMQINSIHLGDLAKYGISFERLLNDGCLNVHIGAYYIKKAQLMKNKGNYWQDLAVYHSKTEDKNRTYASKLIQSANTIPDEWRNFSCQQYNACGLGVAQYQPTVQTGVVPLAPFKSK